jgi:hypothetical protein
MAAIMADDGDGDDYSAALRESRRHRFKGKEIVKLEEKKKGGGKSDEGERGKTAVVVVVVRSI